MKQKRLNVATIIFFLLVNTTYFWEGKLGMYAMFTFLILILFFLILTVFLFGQIFIAFKEKLSNRKRLVLIGLMTTALSSSFFYPSGIINFEKFNAESLLVAQREGAANCLTTLKLRSDNTFIERTVCLGITETTGRYRMQGDTVYFEEVSLGTHESEFYKYAIIEKRTTQNKNNLGNLVKYKDLSDSTGLSLWIVKNELIN